MKKKTVFVIGAGASKEAKLPTGYELKGNISRLLDIRFDWRDQKAHRRGQPLTRDNSKKTR